MKYGQIRCFVHPFVSKNKVHRIQSHSPFGSLSGWSCSAFIVKHGDFVLQEQFVMQLVRQFQQIFKEEGLSLHLTTYSIMALSSESGLIQVVHDAKSIGKPRLELY